MEKAEAQHIVDTVIPALLPYLATYPPIQKSFALYFTGVHAALRLAFRDRDAAHKLMEAIEIEIFEQLTGKEQTDVFREVPDELSESVLRALKDQGDPRERV